MESLFAVALTTGFIGGLGHCTYMCGPIVFSVLVDKNKKHSFLNLQLKQIFYHLGRIFTYSMVGFFMGYTGSFVKTITPIRGFQYYFLLFIGLYLIIYGIEILTLFRFRFFSWFEQRLYSFFQGNTLESNPHKKDIISFSSIITYFREMDSLWKYFLYGIFLGFLPCGLSYTAFITSAGTMDPFKGFIFMFLFGLANIPAIWLVVSFSFFVFGKMRSYIYRIGGLIFLLVGIYLFVASLKKIIQLTF